MIDGLVMPAVVWTLLAGAATAFTLLVLLLTED